MNRDDIIKALDWCPVRHAGPQSLLVRIERVVAQAEAQERERFADECIDIVARWGGSVEIEAAIRARGETK